MEENESREAILELSQSSGERRWPASTSEGSVRCHPQPAQAHISSLALFGWLSSICPPHPSPPFSTVLGAGQCGHVTGLFVLQLWMGLADGDLHRRGEEKRSQWDWGICPSLIPQPKVTVLVRWPCPQSSDPLSSTPAPSPHLSGLEMVAEAHCH